MLAWLHRRAPKPRRVMLVDHEALFVDFERSATECFAGETEMLGQGFGVERLQSRDCLCGRPLYRKLGMQRRPRTDHAQRLVLHRHRKPGLPDRQAETGLVERDGGHVELMFLAQQAVFNVGLGRLLFDWPEQISEVLPPQPQQPAVAVQIVVCSKPRRRRLGGDVAIGVEKHTRNAARIAHDLGLRPRIEFLEHRFLHRLYFVGGRLEWLVVNSSGLTDFLYQRDGEIIAFARPDLAVIGTGLSSAAPPEIPVARLRIAFHDSPRVNPWRWDGALVVFDKYLFAPCRLVS